MTQSKFRLTRELIESGALRQAYSQSTTLRPWSDEQIERSLERTMRGLEADGGAWVFAYGSLLWNPCIEFAEARPATLWGRHRALRLLSKFARGTEQNPGLMLTLAPGGRCEGMALRIAAGDVRRELSALWRREMIAGSYIPRVFSLHTGRGRVASIIFDSDPSHPNYCVQLTFEQEVEIVRSATGFGGSNAEYMMRTHRALSDLGLKDARLAALCKALG